MVYTTPGIILKSRTITNNSKAHFSTYLDYEKRSEAIKLNKSDKQFFDNKNRIGYLKYMTNSKKISPNAKDLEFQPKKNILYGVASKNNIDISIEEYRKIKNELDFIQKNTNASMYIDVVSFDNKFLEENGLYNSKNNHLDHQTVLKYVQDGLKDMAVKEKLSNDTIMLASIHRNTNNIHVHCTTIDPNEKNKKDFRRKYFSLKAFKSKVATKIIGDSNTKILRTIDNQRKILKKALNSKEVFDKKKLNSRIVFLKEKRLRLREIKKSLPENYSKIKKKSRSNSAQMKRPIKLSENYVKWYFEKTNSKLFADYKKSLREEQAFFERVYGRNPRWHPKEIPKLTYYKNDKHIICLKGTLSKNEKGNWNFKPRSLPLKKIKCHVHNGYSFKKMITERQSNPQNRSKIMKSHSALLNRPYKRTAVGEGKDRQIILKSVRVGARPHKIRVRDTQAQKIFFQNRIDPKVLQKELLKKQEMDLPTAQKKFDRFMKESQNIVLDQAQKLDQNNFQRLDYFKELDHEITEASKENKKNIFRELRAETGFNNNRNERKNANKDLNNGYSKKSGNSSLRSSGGQKFAFQRRTTNQKRKRFTKHYSNRLTDYLKTCLAQSRNNVRSLDDEARQKQAQKIRKQRAINREQDKDIEMER
ncbi:relaxase MobL [Lentilactobacillus hilgardii]|uniref:relaxase MobL n=1 Tax=Lentilactobacillus hilgardii TaxID=1588 RepID=UPI00390C6037